MRHRQRHVHATIVKLVREGLAELGWVNAPVNFATTPVTVIDYEPQQAGETPSMNTVSVSIDSQTRNEEYELGGLQEVRYTVFVDIYGESEPIGIALGDDIKDLLEDVSLPVLNFTTSPPSDSAEWMEFENILLERIPTATTTLDKRSWRVVKSTAVVLF